MILAENFPEASCIKTMHQNNVNIGTFNKVKKINKVGKGYG